MDIYDDYKLVKDDEKVVESKVIEDQSKKIKDDKATEVVNNNIHNQKQLMK